jgi:glycosyltransferase involved in cell wall biosynthesis
MTTSRGRPLRVLVLATTFPATGGDGTPEFVLTLSSALVGSGLEVTAVVPRVPGAAREETIDGVRVRRFAYFPKRYEGLADGAIMPKLLTERRRWLEVPPLVTSFLLAARREIHRSRPDVVHAHWAVPAGVVAMTLHQLTLPARRVPYIVTVHGADAFMLRAAPARMLKGAVVRRSAATVPVSAAIGRELGRLGPVTRPIPMGVDVPRIQAEVGPRRPEPGRVLFVGRLVQKKGVDVLLRAAATVPSAVLAIVGDGPDRPGLEALAGELGLAERVTFLGQRSRVEVMAELARAAVVAIPSRVGAGGDQDGTPVVLGEAMAAGVPVVVSDLGGLAEHVADGDNGRVVPAGSDEALARTLDDLLSNPDKAAMLATHASETMVGTLDLTAVRDRYLEILRAAAGR